jgi:hypothetical protein
LLSRLVGTARHEVPQRPLFGQSKNALPMSHMDIVARNQLSETCNNRRDLQT